MTAQAAPGPGMEQGMFAPNGKKDHNDVGTETADVIVLRGSDALEIRERSFKDSGEVQRYYALKAALGQSASRILDNPDLPWNRVRSTPETAEAS